MDFLLIFINFISYLVLLIFIYNLIITLFSIRISKNTKENAKETNSFTVLIPCHNEEDVIETTLEALNNISYNKELCSIYVIADNCSDNTVSYCNDFISHHPKFTCKVLEVKGGSKPKALNAAISILKEQREWNKDNIVIVDADNKVSPTIFNSFNNEHSKGFKLVQCAIRSLNDSSFVAQGFTSAFNNMNRGFQYARNKIGLSGSLSGTGFSINRVVWDQVDFVKCDTLTEDLEFSILSILQGYKVKFVFNDYVLNQHLDEFKPSFIQRVRWARGHNQVFVKLSFTLLKNFFKRPSLQLFDSFLFLSIPFINIIYLFDLLVELITRHFATVSIWVMLITISYWILFYMLCDNWKIRYFFPHLAFSLTMILATAYGTLTYRNKVWAKTVHKKIELPITKTTTPGK